MNDQSDERRGVQSIEVGFVLIEALARGPGKMALKTLAAQAGMSPSKAHLYLVSFMRLRLVAQDPVTSRYALGPAAIELGIAAINQLNVVDVARAHLEELVDRTGLSASLSVWGNRGPTIISRLDGRWPVPLSVRVGFVLPLLSTATGKIFLAHLPEREWYEIAETEDAVDPGRLERARAPIEEVRMNGIALTDSEMNRGFVGLSAPVFNCDGTLSAAITGLGLTSQTDANPDGDAAERVRAAAAGISRELGWTGSQPRLHGTGRG